MRWAPSPDDWVKVARVLRRAGRFGFDTETWGHDVRKTTVPYRGRVHVWSVGVLSGRLSPRGYHHADGVVLPGEALWTPGPLRDCVEDPELPVVGHNLPHDAHAARNHGVTVAGGVDFLQRARLTWPELRSFSLKPLTEQVLGKSVIHYEDVVRDVRRVPTRSVRHVKGKVCACGVQGCRRRLAPHVKTEVVREVVTEGERDERYEVPLESIVPGHPRWDLLLRYSAQDAERVLELEDAADLRERSGHFIDDPEPPWTT